MFVIVKELGFRLWGYVSTSNIKMELDSFEIVKFYEATVERILPLLMKHFLVIKVGKTKIMLILHIFLGIMSP